MKQLFFLLIFLSTITNAQDAEVFKPDSIEKELNAVEIDTPLQIDGVLDEAEDYKYSFDDKLEALKNSYVKFKN